MPEGIVMTENKAQATDASVEAHIASRASAEQAEDCKALLQMHSRLTGQPPRMWGPSIVGFGSYRYTYESGRSGEAPLAGFAIRGRDLVVYLDCEGGSASLLSQLGKHRMGKSCLYFKRLADVDLSVLEQLIGEAIAKTRERYGE
jgi:hypothetical protein